MPTISDPSITHSCYFAQQKPVLKSNASNGHFIADHRLYAPIINRFQPALSADSSRSKRSYTSLKPACLSTRRSPQYVNWFQSKNAESAVT